jgi:MFS family permease
MTVLVRHDRERGTEPGLFGRPYALTTVGSLSLVFLAAFEALAVTTVMPIITEDLRGRALYSLAFSATMAAGVVGMVTAGAWADRRGPTRPLLAAIALFAAGLALAGAAPTMPVFVAARFVQGLGAGGITVALYVLVARVYPASLHPKVFGLFAAAWVVPSMVGPFVAGLVADASSWRWVFLAVVVLVAVATALIVPAIRGGDRQPTTGPHRVDVQRAAAAAVVAVGVVLLSSSSELGRRTGWVVAPAAVMVVAVALHRLVPRGTYRARPGLPATVLLCVVVGAAFFGTEVYLPLLLHDRYGLPAWLSGITLTAGAVAWALGSAVQSRLSDRLSHGGAVRCGAALLFVGIAAELLTVVLTLPPAVAAVGWVFAGAGMGVMVPRVSTLVLGWSAPGEEGFNMSAKSIADAVGGSASLAVAGLIFGALAGMSDHASFVGTLLYSGVVALLAVALAVRVGAR